MDSSRLRTAGWLYLLSIPFTVIVIGINIWGEHASVLPVVIVQTVAAAVTLAMQLFLLRTWRDMLNSFFGFSQTDGPLKALIVMAYIVAATRVINALFTTSIAEPFFDVVLTVVSLVASGITVWFAVRLLRLEDSLGGFRKLYCFLSITGNVCAITIILIPIAILTTIAEMVVASMLFFTMAQRARHVPSGEHTESHLPFA